MRKVYIVTDTSHEDYLVLSLSTEVNISYIEIYIEQKLNNRPSLISYIKPYLSKILYPFTDLTHLNLVIGPKFAEI